MFLKGAVLRRADGSTVGTESLAGKCVAFYFSAHWSGPTPIAPPAGMHPPFVQRALRLRW